MNPGRCMRLFLSCLLWLALPALAVDRIDIQIGQIDYPGAQAEQVRGTLSMDGRWQGEATLKRGDAAQLVKEFTLPVTVSKGELRGRAEFSGEQRSLQQVQADIVLKDAAFNDDSGLHAGERLAAHLVATAVREGDQWRWSGKLDGTDGEVFWQPLYLAKADLGFEGRGRYSSQAISVEQGTLAIGGVGSAQLSAALSRPDNRLQHLEVKADRLDMSGAYTRLLQPFLDKTMLGNLEMAGQADVRLSMGESALKSFSVVLRDFDVEDRNGKFALYKVNANVPWSLNKATQANLRYGGGHMLKMNLGATDLAATLNGYSLTAPEMKLPILDGTLTLSDVSAAFLQQQWHWHLGATLTPISMVDFSHAVGWPVMEGKLAAGIPMVTYTDGMMTMDGAMGIDVFDGSITVDNLAMQNPLGIAPRFQADIRMRNLDLDLLTRTFAFGAMTGRLDGDVKNMVLSRWQPVQFDASFRSAPGSYPKKISQRAVENISALGGAGAAAAIQRSFLRFFKEFNYSKIGLSCKLRKGVCEMDGAEPAKEGYVIVKGSGVPAITVLGYNRSVSWGELLSRIQRVTQGNAKPVIQ
jgi:hypothetical protein